MRIRFLLSSRALMVAVLATGLAALVSCGGGTRGADVDPNNQKEPLRVPLTVVGMWRVEAIDVAGSADAVEPPLGPEAKWPTMTFDPAVGAMGARLSLYTGINKGTAHYFFSPGERDIGAISIERIATTRMAGPEDAMPFEADLLAALPKARTAKRVDGGLLIDCGDVTIRLIK